jgi:hypothetical protein
MKINKVEKELIKKPKELFKYIDSLQKEIIDLKHKLQFSQRNYKTAYNFSVYLLKRLDPNKRKTDQPQSRIY